MIFRRFPRTEDKLAIAMLELGRLRRELEDARATSRDESGRFVSAHHEQVLETARKMRAQMPGHVWRTRL